MASDHEPTIDWTNLPEDTSPLSLWHVLHDGDLLAVESDLLDRTVTLQFDVGYLRDFHHLPENTRFTIVVCGVQSVRALHSVPWPGGCAASNEMTNAERNLRISEYHSKWREESQSWTEFERLAKGDDIEVSNATLVGSSDIVALKLGLLVSGESYCEAYIRGEGVACYIGETQVSPEEFIATGEAYWNAFAEKAKNRVIPSG